ncbi:TPA: hypothetical protein ACPJZ9_003066 [Vibrio diabolicus]
MTRRKFQGPSVEQWFIELESVIRHEILNYIVDDRANKEGFWMWDGLAFIDTLGTGLDCAFEYLEKLEEIENDYDAIKLESAAGSITGLSQAERFLEEKDFLMQIIDKHELEDLSYEAQYRLAVAYPLAKETVKHYIKNLNNYEIPSCLRSLKLNEDFRINNLWDDNNIIDIVKYHLHFLNRTKLRKPVTQKKPKLVTSIKRNQYIDIYPTQLYSSVENSRDLELVTNYKWGVINELKEPYRNKILTYCNDLVQAYMKHLSNSDNRVDKLTPDYTSLPVPPPKKMYVTRYDGYLPLLVGLYCVKNEYRFKKLENREWEVEFESFRDFLEEELFVKFDHLREHYETWIKFAGEEQVVDLKHYINTILSRNVKASIVSVKKLIADIEEEYFSD